MATEALIMSRLGLVDSRALLNNVHEFDLLKLILKSRESLRQHLDYYNDSLIENIRTFTRRLGSS